MNNNEIIDLILKDAVSVFSEDSLRKRLESNKRLKIKLGADPSRPDLHLGHTVVLRKLKLFQQLGHEIIFVIGDFTGMIGDPTGRSKTRPALTIEETQKNGESYFKQVSKILDPADLRVEYNSVWLSQLNFADIIRLTSKYTLARIMERDDFKNRFQSNIPIGLHELLYPLAQGYDSIALAADVEVGGTDQTFNLLVGRVLQGDYGQTPQEVITYPLLAGLDGKEKMSKSLNNYIGIDEPADSMFEKAMRVPDELLFQYFTLTTDIDSNQAESLIKKDVRAAHFAYAKELVTLYHGEVPYITAMERYNHIAAGNLPDIIPTIEMEQHSIKICDLIRKLGFATSNSEARRSIAGKGVKINGEIVEDSAIEIHLSKPVIVQLGKNKICRVKEKSPPSRI
jgi:tyrosyl-tRNA synthetase